MDFVEDDLERDVEECFVLDDFLELCFRLQDISTTVKLLLNALHW